MTNHCVVQLSPDSMVGSAGTVDGLSIELNSLLLVA